MGQIRLGAMKFCPAGCQTSPPLCVCVCDTRVEGCWRFSYFVHLQLPCPGHLKTVAGIIIAPKQSWRLQVAMATVR